MGNNVAGLISFRMTGALLLAGAMANCQAGALAAPQLAVGDVRGLAVSPNGREVLVALGKVAWLWDVETGRQLRPLVGHSGNVSAVAYAPDGKSVLTGSEDNTVRLWDPATGKQLRLFESGGQVHSVAFSPDGRAVLSGGESAPAHLWNAATGKELQRFGSFGAYVMGVAFSPEGRFVLTGNLDNTTILWDTASGKQVRTFGEVYRPNTTPKPGDFPPHGIAFDSQPRWVSSVAFSPDGRFVLAGNQDGTAQMWECATGKESWRFGLGFPGGFAGNPITSVTFSSDGRSVLVGGRDFARMCDATTGMQVRRFEGSGTSPQWAVFSPDGRFVLAGGRQTAAIWDVATGQILRVLF